MLRSINHLQELKTCSPRLSQPATGSLVVSTGAIFDTYTSPQLITNQPLSKSGSRDFSPSSQSRLPRTGNQNPVTSGIVVSLDSGRVGPLFLSVVSIGKLLTG